MNPSENEPNDGPGAPVQVVDTEDAENNPNMEEIMKVPKDTPIYVNTSSGRNLVVEFSENCYIIATLREDEPTAPAAEVITSLVLMMAAARYGGVQESLNKLRELQKGMEVSGN